MVNKSEKLIAVIEELKQHEPIFHHPELGITKADFENMTDDRFFEVGASGKIYSREYVINTLVERYKDPHFIKQDIWETTDFNCIEIGSDNYLLTYILSQGDEKRMSRRSTIWQRTKLGWKIIYHQGTLI